MCCSHHLKWLVVLCCLATFSPASYGQEKKAVTKPAETGLWYGLYTKFQLTNKLYYYAETHYRRKNSIHNRVDFTGRMGKIYNRHGLTYLFNPNFELTFGPVLVLNYSPDPRNAEYEKIVLEPRIWHQWLFMQPLVGKIKLYNQFRFEHRFKRSNLEGAEYKYTNRYRYKLYTYLPINKPAVGNKTFFISPSAEIFMHSGKSVVYNPFEDFRVYTTIGYIYKNWMIYGGHMWTLGQADNGYEYKQSHVIRLNISVNLDLRKQLKQPSLESSQLD